jgi:hypothetical protein
MFFQVIQSEKIGQFSQRPLQGLLGHVGYGFEEAFQYLPFCVSLCQL